MSYRTRVRLLVRVLLAAIVGELVGGTLLLLYAPPGWAFGIVLVTVLLVWLASKALVRYANRAVDEARREWEQGQR